MGSQGITFTITADTAEAAQKVQEFFGRTSEGLNRMVGLGPYLEELGAKIAAAFTVGALVEFTREAINTAENLGRMADKTGLAINTLSALREQAIKLGTPMDQLQMSLGLFADKIYMAVRQGGQAAQVFRDLGVALVTSDGQMRSTDVILEDVAEKFRAMPAGPQKAAAAMELFGRSGRELIPILNEGAEGIERMRQEGGPISEQMVKDATEFNRAIRGLGEEFENLFIKLAKDVLPSLKEFVGWLKDGELAVELGQFSKYFEVSMKAAITDVSNFMLKQIDSWLDKMGEVAGKAGGGPGLLKKAGYGVAGAGVGALGFADFLGSMVGIPGAEHYASLRGQQADDLFAKAGLSGGLINSIVDERLSTAFANAIGKPFGAKLGGNADNPFRAQLEEMRTQMHGAIQGQDAFKNVMSLVQGIGGTLRGLPGLLFGGGGGTGPKAPLSEEAKKLIDEVNKAYQESTQSKVAQLDDEEKKLKEKIDEEVLDHQKAEEIKTKITQAYAVKRTELLDKEKAAALEIKLAEIQGQRSLVDKDPTQTEAQKREKLVALLRQENMLIEQNIALQKKRLQDTGLSDEAHLEASKQLQELELRHAETTRGIETTSAQGTFGGEFRTVMTDLGNQWGTWASQTATAFKTVFNEAISSISSGITGLIMGTERWGRALMQIGTSILTSIVQAILEMGIRWVMTQIMMAVAGKAIAASNAAALAPIAAAQSAIWAAPATLATISSYGGAAASAPGLIAAAVGVTQGTSAAGFSEGGFTGPGGRNEPAGIVHRGEYVFSAPAVKRIGLGRLQSMHDGGAVGGAGAGRQQPGGSGAGVNVHVWENGSGMANYIRTHPQVQHEIVTLMGKNAYKIR